MEAYSHRQNEPPTTINQTTENSEWSEPSIRTLFYCRRITRINVISIRTTPDSEGAVAPLNFKP